MPTKNKKLAKDDSKPVAFVISPIGDSDSPERKRADQILKHVIDPIVSELGYEVIRADKISKPGIITSQIIEHIINDPLVIADLTGHNPNVFYELAVRHTIKKPVIQMIRKGERIPFDVSTTRTIQIDHQDLDSVDEASKELRKQIKAVEKDPSLADSPISVVVHLQLLRKSEDPQSKAIAQLGMELSLMHSKVQTIYEEVVPTKFLKSEYLWKGSRSATPVSGVLLSQTEPPSSEAVEKALENLRKLVKDMKKTQPESVEEDEKE